jgi:hypothetical protein
MKLFTNTGAYMLHLNIQEGEAVTTATLLFENLPPPVSFAASDPHPPAVFLNF